MLHHTLKGNLSSRLLRGFDRVFDGAVRLPGDGRLREVVRQLGDVGIEVRGVEPFECLANVPMQPGPLTWVEFGDECFLDEGVGEAVPGGSGGIVNQSRVDWL